MEGLDKEKDGVLIISTPLYPKLTLDKLKQIIIEVFNQPRVKNKFNQIERLYENMSPENRKLFDDALINAYPISEDQIKFREKQEHNLFYTLKSKEIIPQLKPKLIGTGKIRNKMLHLKPKKKRKK